MTQFHIKVIAVVVMLIDHIGLFFFPEVEVFRTIGRLSFPLFAWLIANGAYHTRSIYNYLIRLLALAFISQIPYVLANRQLYPSFSNPNIFFTLALGLAAIIIIKKTKNKCIWSSAIITSAFIANQIQADYGEIGVISIVAFYIFFNNINYLIISQILIYTIPYILASSGISFIVNVIDPFAIFALLFITLYNNKQGPKFYYLFYLIYPLQYIIFYFILAKFLK